MLKNFTTQEKKIFWGCAICYMLAYVGRFNLAPALSGITETFALTAAQSGLIQTMLAAVYAVGQVVNGILADRVNCRRHITMGLIGTAVCNLLVGCASSYTQVLVLWALNGAFQSMLWTPVVRIMADWYEGEKRGRVTYYMCFTFIIGHFLAWAISGSMKSIANWRFAFWVPAAVMAANAVLAYTLLRDRREARAAEGTAPVETIARMPIRDMMFKTGLWAVLIGCVFTGIARDGVMTWAPSLIDSRAGKDGKTLCAKSDGVADGGENECSQNVKEENDTDRLGDLTVIRIDDRSRRRNGAAAADAGAYAHKGRHLAVHSECLMQEECHDERCADGGNDDRQALESDTCDGAEIQREAEDDDCPLQYLL